MSREIPFLEDIRRQPRNTTIRSIYADWLEDEDDPRGEYVRLRLALNRSGYPPPRYAEMEARRKQVLALIEKAWLAVLGKGCYFKLWLALLGETVSGRVSRITGEGVYVDLGGLEGLCHITPVRNKLTGHGAAA